MLFRSVENLSRGAVQRVCPSPGHLFAKRDFGAFNLSYPARRHPQNLGELGLEHASLRPEISKEHVVVGDDEEIRDIDAELTGTPRQVIGARGCGAPLPLGQRLPRHSRQSGEFRPGMARYLSGKPETAWVESAQRSTAHFSSILIVEQGCQPPLEFQRKVLCTSALKFRFKCYAVTNSATTGQRRVDAEKQIGHTPKEVLVIP